MPSKTRVRQLIPAFSGKTIIVLGDVMLDAFVWGKVRRISPEAPVPVVEVIRETYSIGAAGNVAANIQALGGTPLLMGVVGKDAAAERVVDLMSQSGIEISGLIADDRPTTLKTRILAHNQQVVRTDRESRDPLNDETNAHLRVAFERRLPDVQAVIISDYDKGVVNANLLSELLPMAQRARIPVFLDPKVHHAEYYRPISVITPNHREAELLTGMAIDSEDALQRAGRRLLERFGCEYALVTRGEEGMSLFHGTTSKHLPALAREVYDVTGAGDTVIATLALAFSGGATMEEAADLANHAAGIVVGKVGTATATAAELLDSF